MAEFEFELDYINLCDVIEKITRCLNLTLDESENYTCPSKVVKGNNGTSCIPPQNSTNCPNTMYESAK